MADSSIHARFAKIMMECNFGGDDNIIVHDVTEYSTKGNCERSVPRHNNYALLLAVITKRTLHDFVTPKSVAISSIAFSSACPRMHIGKARRALLNDK